VEEVKKLIYIIYTGNEVTIKLASFLTQDFTNSHICSLVNHCQMTFVIVISPAL